MRKKILISVGGTGGHIYPAMGLAQQLLKADPDLGLLFVGGHLADNRYLNKQAFSHKSISCGSFTSKNPFSLLSSMGRIAKGVRESCHVIEDFKPNLIVGFGSYHTFPTMVAAKLCRVPILLHASDSIPGKVIRLFSGSAVATGIQFPDTARWLRGNAVEVGMPLREGFRLGACSQAEARNYFQINESKSTLLVFGGSQGAAAINNLISESIVGELGHLKDVLQVIHVTGNAESSAKLRLLYQRAGIMACVKDFETRMDQAWQAATFVISRAGAASIAEQFEFEVPGILIPYPHAADNHQEKNAIFMADKVGAAEMFKEAQLDGKKLCQAIRSFLTGNCEKASRMQEAIRHYKKQARTVDLCALVRQVIYT